MFAAIVGARLCDGDKGSVGNVVCPYHQWTYDLTGKLIHTEHMGDEFDRSQFGLKMVHVGNIAGLLFICLADKPPSDFEQMRRDMEPYVLPHKISDCKIAYEEDLIENGNWKFTMENNRECYHCKANHPELTVRSTNSDLVISLLRKMQRKSTHSKTSHSASTSAGNPAGCLPSSWNSSTVALPPIELSGCRWIKPENRKR